MHWPTKLRKLSHTSREREKEREGEGEREEAKRQSSYSRTISQFCLLSVSAIFLLLSLSSPQRDTNLFSSLPSFYFCFFFYSVLSHWLFTLMKFTCLIFMPCLVPSPICHLSCTIDYIRYTIYAWWICLSVCISAINLFQSKVIGIVCDSSCIMAMLMAAFLSRISANKLWMIRTSLAWS